MRILWFPELSQYNIQNVQFSPKEWQDMHRKKEIGPTFRKRDINRNSSWSILGIGLTTRWRFKIKYFKYTQSAKWNHGQRMEGSQEHNALTKEKNVSKSYKLFFIN